MSPDEGEQHRRNGVGEDRVSKSRPLAELESRLKRMESLAVVSCLYRVLGFKLTVKPSYDCTRLF